MQYAILCYYFEDEVGSGGKEYDDKVMAQLAKVLVRKLLYLTEGSGPRQKVGLSKLISQTWRIRWLQAAVYGRAHPRDPRSLR